MNFKLVPTICPHGGSNLAEKVGKVIDGKPWMEYQAYAGFHQVNRLPVLKQSDSYDKAVSFIADETRKERAI